MMWDWMAAPAPVRGLLSARHLAEAPCQFKLRPPPGGYQLRLLMNAAL